MLAALSELCYRANEPHLLQQGLVSQLHMLGSKWRNSWPMVRLQREQLDYEAQHGQHQQHSLDLVPQPLVAPRRLPMDLPQPGRVLLGRSWGRSGDPTGLGWFWPGG